MRSFFHNKYRRLAYLLRGVRTVCPQLKNWWLFVLDAGLLPRGKIYVFHYKNGLSIAFRARTSDAIINEEVFGGGAYALSLGGDAPRLRRCIDLGAQTGVFTLYALSQCPNLRVVSAEATRENFALLKRNIETNGFSERVDLRHQAAWSASGQTIRMRMSSRNTGGHSAVEEGDEFAGAESVTTVSLADLVGDTPCDILKIDIEGAEYEVLRKASFDTLSRIARIVGELHGEEAEKSGLIEYLRASGFAVSRNGDLFLAERLTN
ncbi:MAG: FkbM family methyltransferase [Patescibacteria group bacterium]|nr:FkbM family methyltransferase [Patescibacteria group bacterium]MDE1944203.1 FkbM family methyltransferase [Patescibacteria group bacterium]MDE2057894.1 FkbM family methyltransferase [Patescibacteria group bacterium]